jgi:hypothetical protein
MRNAIGGAAKRGPAAPLSSALQSEFEPQRKAAVFGYYLSMR